MLGDKAKISTFKGEKPREQQTPPLQPLTRWAVEADVSTAEVVHQNQGFLWRWRADQCQGLSRRYDAERWLAKANTDQYS